MAKKIVEYRALKPLFIGRARAANPGDIITSTTLENQPHWKDSVEPVDAADSLDINASAEKVLSWVDDDPDRAKLALLAENDKGEKARKGLVSELEALAGSHEQV